MLKKVTALTAMLALALLIAFAPLVLAQQDASLNQPTGETAQSPLINLGDPFRLDEAGNLIVDCRVAFQNLAQLQPFSDTLTNDPEFQSKLSEAKELTALCADNGYSPLESAGGTNQPSQPNSAGFQQYQGIGQTHSTTMPSQPQ